MFSEQLSRARSPPTALVIPGQSSPWIALALALILALSLHTYCIYVRTHSFANQWNKSAHSSRKVFDTFAKLRDAMVQQRAGYLRLGNTMASLT